MKQQGEKLIFESGKELSPNGGYIGINQDGEICKGYDGKYHIFDPDVDWILKDETLSGDDVSELAEFMIERWKKLIKR